MNSALGVGIILNERKCFVYISACHARRRTVQSTKPVNRPAKTG